MTLIPSHLQGEVNEVVMLGELLLLIISYFEQMGCDFFGCLLLCYDIQNSDRCNDKKRKTKIVFYFVSLCALLSSRPKQYNQNSGVDSLSCLRASSRAVSQQTAPAKLHVLPVGPFYILKILFLTFTTVCVYRNCMCCHM